MENCERVAEILYNALKEVQLTDLLGDDLNYEQIEKALRAWETRNSG